MDRLQYIQNLKEKLYSTDYIATKNSEGIDCSEYGDWKKDRQDIRDEINLISQMTDEEFNVYKEDE